MRAIKRSGGWLLCAALLILLLLGRPQQTGQAQSSGDEFELVADLIGGGGWSSGGSFSNGGAIGEPCVAVQRGSAFVLQSGFLHGGSLVEWLYDLHLPVVLRGHVAMPDAGDTSADGTALPETP